MESFGDIEGILMRSRKWISIKGLGVALAVMMLLSCVVIAPNQVHASTQATVPVLALGASTVPTAPLNVVADAGNHFVWLWWDHPTNQGSDLIKNYTIYRNSTGSSTNFVKLATEQIGPFNPVGTNLPYNDTTVLNNVAYHYEITADSDAGSSPVSNIATVTPAATGTAPGAVQNLVAVNNVYSAQLNWTLPAAGSTPIRYINVYVPTVFGTAPEKLPANAVGFNVTSVSPGQSYNYTVRAISSTWGSANATVEKFIGGTGDVPGSPEKLTAIGLNSSVLLDWSDPANPSSHGVNNYTIFRSDSQTGPFTYIGNSSLFFSILLPFYSDNTAINGHKYYYEVVSNNAFGSSAPSNVASATPKYTPEPPVANAYPGNGKVLLVWSVLSNTTSIDIFRSTTAGSLGTLMNSSTETSVSRFFWYDNSTTNGNKYYYTVRANFSNVLVPSAQANATPFAGSPPAAPTNLIATPDESNVGLYANLANSTDFLIGYHIYRGNTSGSEAAVPILNGSLLFSLGLSSLTQLLASDDTPAADDINYYYYVTVENLFGNSTHSNEAVSFASTNGDVPDPVTNLAASGGNGQVTLTWSNPVYQGTANVLGYEVWRSNGTLAFPIQFLVYTGLGQQTFVDKTVQAGKTYTYYVTAANLYGDALAPSNQATVTTTPSNVAPTAPQNLVATVGIGYVRLSWSVPTTVGPGILNYTIYRGNTSGNEGNTVYRSVSGSTLTYNDTNVISGQNYYYQVAAVNSIGTGPKSTEAAAPAPTAPTAPQSVTGFASPGQIQLNWTAPSYIGTGLTEYRVYRGTTAGGEGTTPIVVVPGTTLTSIDVNVRAGNVYYYKVRAVSAAGLGPNSTEVSQTAVTVAGVPSAPFGLTGVGGNSYVLLNWTAPTSVGSGVTSYLVYRGISSSGELPTPITTLSGTTLSYNDTTPTVEVPSYYIVKAVNSNGLSDPSNEATATALNPALPTSPTNIVATPGPGKIVLTWNAPTYVGTSPITHYLIYRSDNGSTLTLLTTVGADVTTYTDTAVVQGHTYGYTVVAENANGVGTMPTQVTAVPGTPSAASSTDNTALYAGIAILIIIILIILALLFMRMRGKMPVASAPIGLTAIASAGKVQLNWSAPTKVGKGVTEYQVYRGTMAGGEGTVPINSVSGTIQMFDDTTVVAGTSYYYVVKAVNSSGVGPASNEVNVTAM